MKKSIAVFIFILIFATVFGEDSWTETQPRFRSFVFHEGAGVATSVSLTRAQIDFIREKLRTTNFVYLTRLNSEHWMGLVHNNNLYYIMLHDKTRRFNSRAVVNMRNGNITIKHGVDYVGFSRSQSAYHTAIMTKEYLALAMADPSRIFGTQAIEPEKPKPQPPARVTAPDPTPPATVVKTNIVWKTNVVEIAPSPEEDTVSGEPRADVAAIVSQWEREIEEQERNLIPPRRRPKHPIEVAMEVWDYLSQFPVRDNLYHTLPEVVVERGDMDSDDFALYAYSKFKQAGIDSKILVVDYEEGKAFYTVCVFKTLDGWKLMEQGRGIMRGEVSDWKSLPGRFYRRTVRFQPVDVENTWLKGISVPLHEREWMVSVYFDDET